MEPQTADSLATTLITLLDNHNTLRGLYLFSHPDPSTRPSTTLPPLPTDGTPIAIQMKSTPSLATHLAAQNTDTQTLEILSVKIHTLLKSHPSASPAAHTHLNTAYRNLLEYLPPSQSAKSAMSTASFAAQTDLPQKLANLRHMQHHLSASQLQRPPEFVTNLVADIDSAGRPDPMLKIYLPVYVEWAEYEHALTINTHRRWTYDFSHYSSSTHSSSYDDDDDDDDDASANFPNTYKPQNGGGWIYQRTKTTGQAENISRSLTNSDEFLAMREEQGKGDWGALPLVWPARVYEASTAARKVEKAAREVRGDFEGTGFGVEGVDFRMP